MKDIVYIVFDSNDPPKSLVGLKQYKFQRTCQVQVTRRNKYSFGSNNYIVKRVELKLI